MEQQHCLVAALQHDTRRNQSQCHGKRTRGIQQLEQLLQPLHRHAVLRRARLHDVIYASSSCRLSLQSNQQYSEHFTTSVAINH
jgi:hypothetical protein